MGEEYTVLVVDDEKVIRDGCTLILKSEGYRVATAKNGREALEILEREPVNVVLCDLKMPVMGALEVLEQANLRFPDIPIIIITGHGTVDDAVECMKKGAYDFVTKPFRIDPLNLCIKRALEKQSLERQTRRLQEEQARNLYTLAIEQSRLHTIVNCMADGLLVTNRKLEVVLCNPSFARLSGNNPTPPLPAPLARCFNDPGLQEILEEIVSGQEPERCVYQEIRRGLAHFRAMSAPFFGPDGEILGTVTVFHDVTSFKELDEMKTFFVNMTSHELRSPLSAIKLQHSVILDGLAGDLTEKQREILTRAHDKIQGLLDLINELLDVARIEAGHRQLEPAPLKLGPVLQEIVDLLQTKAQEQKVLLKMAVPADLPLILADRRGMEEVFTNLITNAINYSPDGGEVVVSAQAHPGRLEVRVQDQGIGIEPGEISKIFDKFYRVKHPKARQVIGTGLGLALVKGIVELHQGAVEVESQVGEGSTFKIFLPLAPL
jgi:signal transduction histidine kinase